MNQPAIRVRNLSKRYEIGAREHRHRTFREAIVETASTPLLRLCRRRGMAQGENAVRANILWALRDVSFDIGEGEVVGVIGRNGAGKSTLLKVLSRITEPTTGEIRLSGRVGSLLEVGTGFHPELTGRENIYLNGAILGMSGRAITRAFDEIVAFAEVQDFIETPVKRYSSGMYLRLAFAVAAHLQPEILLVDEVLAVGDAAFQNKCLGKMGEVARQGRTVLFVSHNMAAILNLCEKVLTLSRGHAVYAGGAQEGVQQYMETDTTASDADVDLSSHPSRRVGCTPILKRVRLLDKDGGSKGRFMTGEALTIEFTVDSLVPLADPQFGIGVDDWLGVRLFSLMTGLSNCQLPNLGGPCKVSCHISELPLLPGRYSLSLSAGTTHHTLVDALDNAVCLEVEGADFFANGRMPAANLGRVLVRSNWEMIEQ